MRRLLFLAGLLSLRSACAATAAGISGELHAIAFDPAACYRVLEQNFSKEDLKIYLTSGYLVFTKPIEGKRLGAAFVSSQEGGDAEVLLLPPTRAERFSLSNFTGAPNLEEHFQAGLFVFTDGTGEQLMARLEGDSARKSPEMGNLIAEQYTPVIRNLTGSFETRLTYDLLSGSRDAGLFYAAISGRKLGNFDVLYDPTAHDQILAGKLAYRDNHAFYDTWTAFPARSFRNGAPPRSGQFVLDNYRIQATIEPSLELKAVARVELTIKQAALAVPLSLASSLRVTSATVDGEPVEVFGSDSLRASLIAGGDERQFLLVCTRPLDPAKTHQIDLGYEGNFIRNAGDDVYFVSSRGEWYPRAGSELARYDLTFRYPKNLTVAAIGDTVEDRLEGDWRVTRNTTSVPARFAGFNLGDFTSRELEQDGYRIAVYANRRLETALQPKAAEPPAPSQPSPIFRRRPADTSLLNAPSSLEPEPASRLNNIARDVADTLAFMSEQFGPTPIRHLDITPIPGTFGQGFPGLVYLSTLAYLNPSQLPPSIRQRQQALFYSDLLESHEVAHQWWGNFVIPASSHDDWLMEALSSYSALLLLEKKRGVKALESVLEEYRTHLLTKTESGRTLEGAGPITWGLRLESSLAPDAWRTVTYEKGTWIIHMLRRRMGDQKFFALLREVCNLYRFRPLSTEQFRELAQQYMPSSTDASLKAFFDSWVYGTGIPSVMLRYSVHGPKLTGTISQSDVDDAFTAMVPVEVLSGKQRNVYWLATAGDPVSFTLSLKAPPSKVTLLIDDCLITTSK